MGGDRGETSLFGIEFAGIGLLWIFSALFVTGNTAILADDIVAGLALVLVARKHVQTTNLTYTQL